MNLHSTYFMQCPFFSELPYKFNLDNIDRTGMDVLFYGQEHYDTMAILDGKKSINREHFAENLEK